MKAHTLFIFAVTAAVLASCGGGDELASKKAKLEELKKQQSELKASIDTLETQIKKLSGDNSANVKIKDITVLAVQPKEFKHYLEIQGKVDSDKNVTVSAMAAGTITKILVNRGDVVSKGTVLATLDDDIIRKGIAELDVNINLTKTLFEKQKALWEQNIGTEVQYISAKTTYEGLLKRKEQLLEQQSAYRIKATIDGTIDEIYPNEGEVTAPGVPAFRLVNTSAFKVLSEVAEGYIDKIKKGDKAVVYFPDLDYTMDTYVKVISDIINPMNRTFTVEFDLRNAPKKMKANMLAYVKILDYANPSALVVPVNVIQHSEKSDFLYVAKGNKASKVSVKTGNIYRTDAEIVSGIAEGDQVITVGYQEMTDGQLVKIQK